MKTSGQLIATMKNSNGTGDVQVYSLKGAKRQYYAYVAGMLTVGGKSLTNPPNCPYKNSAAAPTKNASIILAEAIARLVGDTTGSGAAAPQTKATYNLPGCEGPPKGSFYYKDHSISTGQLGVIVDTRACKNGTANPDYKTPNNPHNGYSYATFQGATESPDKIGEASADVNLTPANFPSMATPTYLYVVGTTNSYPQPVPGTGETSPSSAIALGEIIMPARAVPVRSATRS